MNLNIVITVAVFCALSKIKSAASCYCGIPNRSTRIVNGVDTEKNEYPWQIGIVNSAVGKRGGGWKKIEFYKSQPFCGGSIIDSRTVLTAAHCLHGINGIIPARELEVLVGEHDTTLQDGQVRIGVKEVIIHPEYEKGGVKFNNDFTLLILEFPVQWSKLARPVCLPQLEPAAYENVDATVSGWGKIYSRGTHAVILQEAVVKTMQNSACVQPKSDYIPEKITQNMMCAASPMKDSCQGDSGGPLVFKEEDGYFSQIGVVSWGKGCAKEKAPGVYARVTRKIDWIKSNMKGETCPIPPIGTPGLLRCTGQDNKCCTKEKPCDEGEGDCDTNDECMGKLVCGKNNCPKHGYDWDVRDDCCFNFEEKPGPDQCHETRDCEEGHGDCDEGDCKEGLECGKNNCEWNSKKSKWWQLGKLNLFKDDCCVKE